MPSIERFEMVEEVASRASTAVLMGAGGGSDCLVANLLRPWLHTLGVNRVIGGGIGCQWWPEPGIRSTPMTQVLGADLYDPLTLENADPISEHAVIVSSATRRGEQVPFEAVLADYLDETCFVVSLRGGGLGAASGLRAVIEHAKADLVIAVDVGSDSLSTGQEIIPVQTALADHLTMAALLQQDVPTFFGLAGYGCDAELELEDLDINFSRIIAGGGLRGCIAPHPADIDDLDELHRRRSDPVGGLVGKANRGEFGLHRVPKDSPWGAVARLGPAAIPIWILDPQTVVREVARDVNLLLQTSSVSEAERAYLDVGRIPETTLARMVDYGRDA